MILAVAQVLYERNFDKKFVAQHVDTEGFEKSALCQWGEDGVPKTPEWEKRFVRFLQNDQGFLPVFMPKRPRTPQFHYSAAKRHLVTMPQQLL
jgi:hypothetical protein